MLRTSAPRIPSKPSTRSLTATTTLRTMTVPSSSCITAACRAAIIDGHLLLTVRLATLSDPSTTIPAAVAKRSEIMLWRAARSILSKAGSLLILASTTHVPSASSRIGKITASPFHCCGGPCNRPIATAIAPAARPRAVDGSTWFHASNSLAAVSPSPPAQAALASKA